MKNSQSLLLLVMMFGFHNAAAAPTMGPIGNIILLSGSNCDEKYAGDDFSVNATLNILDDKGTKAVSGTVVIKTPIDPSTPIRLELFKWVGSGWQRVYDYKGKLCRDMKLLGKVLDQLAAALVPPVDKRCPLKPGTYSLKDFQASSKDLAMPGMFYGRFSSKFTIMNNSGKVQTCLKMEFDSQAPA